MRYEGTIYRPPSEANSLLIQATIGCPHNRCVFCGMYRKKKFRIRPVAEIKEDLIMARSHYGPNINSIFFPDGNSIFMKTDELIEILEYARELFPQITRMTVYGSAKFLKYKSPTELFRLRQAGLSRIHAGLETGDDPTLLFIEKGFTAAEAVENGLKVKEAGIELSEYVLIGIAGMDRSLIHAHATARVLNEIKPDFIRLRTYVPVPRTPLYEAYQRGEFHLPGPYGALKETRTLIENLSGPGQLFSDHISNFAWINGSISNDKGKMLAILDELLQLPEQQFQSVDFHRL